MTIPNPLETPDVMAGTTETENPSPAEEAALVEKVVSIEETVPIEEVAPEKPGLPEEQMEVVKESMERGFRYISEIFEESIKPLEKHNSNMVEEIQGVFISRDIRAYENPADPTSEPSIEHFEETKAQFSEAQLEEYSYNFSTFEDDLGDIKQKFETLVTSDEIGGMQEAGDRMIQLEGEFTELIQTIERQVLDVQERRNIGIIRKAEYFYDEVLQRSQRAVYPLEEMNMDPYDSVVWQYRRSAQIISETIEEECRTQSRRENTAIDSLYDMRKAFANAGEIFIGAHGFIENEKKQKASV